MSYTREEKRTLLVNALDFLDESEMTTATDACLGLCLGMIQSWIGVASDARPLKAGLEAALGNYESQ